MYALSHAFRLFCFFFLKIKALLGVIATQDVLVKNYRNTGYLNKLMDKVYLKLIEIPGYKTTETNEISDSEAKTNRLQDTHDLPPKKKKKKPNYLVPSNASSNNRYLVRNMLWLH